MSDAPSALPPVADAEPFVKARFGGLLMVCGDCQRRSSGPTRHTAKELRGELKKAVGHTPVRWRVVECSCLGLCPKKATAVATCANGSPVLLAAVRKRRDVDAVAQRLRDDAPAR